MKKILFFIFLLACSFCSAQDRPRVGVVLGGGGAKGAAEVGVLHAIEQAGIPIDYIAGTSIGAIVGGLYASGYTPHQLDSLFRTQEWLTLLTDRREDYKSTIFAEEDGTSYLFGFPILQDFFPFGTPNAGTVKGDSIVELLTRMTAAKGIKNMQQTPIPFRCVATAFKGINPTKEVVLSKGNIAKAMRASMAIPIYFRPVKINNMVLLDGGFMNNLPVDVVRKMGADIIIAIDLTQNKESWPELLLGEKWGLGGLIDWLISRPDIAKYRQNTSSVDIYINPRLDDCYFFSFGEKKIAQMLRQGYEAGQKALPELRKLRKKIYKQE